MSDTFNVVATWSQNSYSTGETAVATISGDAVVTQTVTITSTLGPITLPIVAADGAQSEVVVPAVDHQVVTTNVSSESVTIDVTRPIVDSGPNPLTWVVSADKLSISAVV